MRSMKMLLIVGAAVSVVAAACGGSTTNTGNGNESDSGSGSGGSSGSSSGGTDASSSSSGGSSGSSSGSGGSSGSSSGGMMGEGGLTCTPTSCGASGLCCVGFGNGMITSMCVTGTMCPTGDRQLCDPNNPMCPPGEVCRTRMGGMYGTCRVPMDGGMMGEGGMDAAGGG